MGAFGTIGIGYVPHITMEGDVSSLSSGLDASQTYNANGVAGGIATGRSSNGSAKMSDAFVKLADREAMMDLFDVAVNWSFNSGTKTLKLFQESAGPILVEAALEYIPDREYDEVYGETWVKEYSLALVKRRWGENLGKYDQVLVGGGAINYDRIISEAQTEIERLDDQLLERYMAPLGVFSG